MLLTPLVVSLSAIGIASGIASGRPSAHKRTAYAVKERHAVPSSWTKLGPASKRDTLQLTIGLKQQNEGEIERHLMQVSDPDHERYGQHLSHDEVKAIVAPSGATLAAVRSWLQAHGIRDWVHNHAQDMIHCEMSVQQAERLLDTTYHTFRHTDGTQIHRAPEWSLPESLHEHVDLVQPTTSFFHPEAQLQHDDDVPWKDLTYWQDQNKPGMFGDHPTQKATDTTPGDCETGGGRMRPVVPTVQSNREVTPGGQPGPVHQTTHRHAAEAVEVPHADLSKICRTDFVTPQCIRTLYGTINYKPQVPDRNGMGTTNYLNQTAHRADIEKFLRTFRPDAAPAAQKFDYVVIAGGANGQGAYTQEILDHRINREANMDAINAISVIYPSKFMTWSTGGSPPFHEALSTPKNTNEPFLTWLDYVLGQSSLPQVISTSYGDDEQTVPYSYARRVCSGLAQLGVRGVSVVFSTGDKGVGSGDGEDICYANDATSQRRFISNFPAGCPWVTAVGATELAVHGQVVTETASEYFASGAGFSRYFPMPEYQTATVKKYLQSLPKGMHQGLFNPAGRGYPDVSAHGGHDAIVWNGLASTMGGTSASAPTFGGVITLVNDALIAAGRPPLGFLNPWLYKDGYRALTDITNGSSFGCDTKGFPAAPGWDAVTGLGTPNFARLVNSAMNVGATPRASSQWDVSLHGNPPANGVPR